MSGTATPDRSELRRRDERFICPASDGMWCAGSGDTDPVSDWAAGHRAAHDRRELLRALDSRDARIASLEVAINGFRWVGNNLHNSATRMFRDAYRAALEDARKAMGDDWQPMDLLGEARVDVGGPNG